MTKEKWDTQGTCHHSRWSPSSGCVTNHPDSWHPGACGHLGQTRDLCHPCQPPRRPLGTRCALPVSVLAHREAGGQRG